MTKKTLVDDLLDMIELQEFAGPIAAKVVYFDMG